MRISRFAVRSILCAACIPVVSMADTVVFSENFDGASGGVGRFNDYVSAPAAATDYQIDYNYDYSTFQYKRYSTSSVFTQQPIPAAPGGSTTKGLRIGLDRVDGVSQLISTAIIPKLADNSPVAVSENFKLSFDMWMNYNGPATGGSNSTEQVTAGLNKQITSGIAGVAQGTTIADPGYVFRVSGEGGNGGSDYQIFSSDQASDGASYPKTNANWTAANELRYNHTTGVLSGTAIDTPGDANNSYAESVFPVADYETRGAPGKHWVPVTIEQHGNIVEWKINGQSIISHFLDTVASGSPTLGYTDIFTTDAGAVQNEQFALFDNIVVTQLDALSKFTANTGDYATPGNWTNGVPNGAGKDAIFEGASGASNLTVNSPVTLRSMTFNSPDGYNLSGSSSIALSSVNNDLLATAGNNTIGVPVTLSGHLSVSVLQNATLTLSKLNTEPTKNVAKTGKGSLIVNKIRGTALTISEGTLQLKNGGGTSRVTSMVMPTGYTQRLDIGNNALIVDYPLRTNAAGTVNNDPFLSFRLLVAAGAAENWNPSARAITSNQAAADFGGAHPTAVGYADASILFGPSGGTFNGEAVDGSSILFKYTYQGDSNLDGTVNALDFNAVAANFGTTLSGATALKPSWTEADFNFDGTVDVNDFTALSMNFGFTIPSSGASLGTLVPEPASCAGVALLGMLAGQRRLRRRR